MNKREFIAMNVARFLNEGEVVNLGVGIPTLAASYIPDGREVLIHAEDGAVGCGVSKGYPWDNESREGAIASRVAYAGEKGSWKTMHKDLCDASGDAITLIPGAACCDSVMAFAVARGGRLDATVLGALQVDRQCNLANWKIPGKKMNGMGGAMDIVSGAKRVIIAMEHCNKAGESKIVDECTLPLTAAGCVTMIVTDKCIIQCEPGRLTVTELAPGVTKQEVIDSTATSLAFADELGEMITE